jgi:type II secretory pathway pseudopilin PulG
MPTLRHARIRKAVPLAALVLVLAAGVIGLTAIRRARERELQTNLYTLRTVIDNYTYDQGKEPSSYQDLVDNGYLRKIPGGAPAVLPGGVRQE